MSKDKRIKINRGKKLEKEEIKKITNNINIYKYLIQYSYLTQRNNEKNKLIHVLGTDKNNAISNLKLSLDNVAEYKRVSNVKIDRKSVV